MAELKPCPFCGGSAMITVCDDEGNYHDAGYESDPWSGLGFQLRHDESMVKGDCPIATHEDETTGMYVYDSREEAEAAWNTRSAKPEARALMPQSASDRYQSYLIDAIRSGAKHLSYDQWVIFYPQPTEDATHENVF